jgi:tetratricopeptide (TPR) repeat protein
MKTSVSILILFLFLSCGNKARKLKEEIDLLRTDPKYAVSDSLFGRFQAYVNECPKGPMAGKYLYSSAVIRAKQGRAREASEIYERVYTTYKDSSFAADALYNAAICREAIPDPANSVRLYEEFLKVYPNHENASNVKSNLEFVGMAPEKVAEIIFKRNKEKEELDSLRTDIEAQSY